MDDIEVDKKVGQYVALRDKLKEMEKAYTDACAPIREVQNIISGQLMEFLNKTGSDSVKTKKGTVYATTRFTASLADADAFMQYVIANNKFDLMDRRANATACKDFVAEKGTPPPGVNLNSMVTIGVRRA